MPYLNWTNSFAIKIIAIHWTCNLGAEIRCQSNVELTWIGMMVYDFEGYARQCSDLSDGLSVILFKGWEHETGFTDTVVACLSTFLLNDDVEDSLCTVEFVSTFSTTNVFSTFFTNLEATDLTRVTFTLLHSLFT